MDYHLEDYDTIDYSSDQVSLLISLLVRFPEIGTVHYDPLDQVLRLVFLLKGVLSENLDTFGTWFESHLAVFHTLKQEPVSVATIRRVENGELGMLEIRRDLPSLSREEINLIIQLVSDYFSDSLVREGPDVSEDDKEDQDFLIDSMLSSGPLKGNERLTGFRESGRVLVFSIPKAGVSKT